jgi:hypothetical protein
VLSPLWNSRLRARRHTIQRYSRTNDTQMLIETVRALYQHQGAGSSQEFSTDKPVSKIRREYLKLIRYEYIDA